ACATAAVGVGCLCESSRGDGALMHPADHALPGICGCVLRPILPVRVELASEVSVQISVSVLPRLHASCVPRAPATGTNRQGPEAEGKADSRDGRRALAIASLKR